MNFQSGSFEMFEDAGKLHKISMSIFPSLFDSKVSRIAITKTDRNFSWFLLNLSAFYLGTSKTLFSHFFCSVSQLKQFAEI